MFFSYKDMVVKKINQLCDSNKVPIIEGGSGFYLKYLLTGNNDLYDNNAWADAEIKAKNIIAENKTWVEW